MPSASDARFSRWRRRALLAGGAVVVLGWIVGAPRLPTLWSSDLSYRPLPDLPPFRELEREGSISTAAILFAGLDGREEPDAQWAQQLAAVRADPCQAIYGMQLNDMPTGTVPVAVFSDARCPSCRILETMIDDFERRNGSKIHVVRHHLPLLGSSSIIAARAALAAGSQGGEEAMWRQLLSTPFMINETIVASAAEAAGLQPQQVLADMSAPSVDDALLNSRAIAGVFGFYGTPATVVGRTTFLGAIPATDFEELVAEEQADRSASCHTSTSQAPLR